ncbi:hypothetical protein MJ561_10555 [Klebsiella pneumoniae]|nr:hypothetical protein MJ561_10555 [Klebsiella pneumoniae]
MIEFAQSGLKPLISCPPDGIRWHVLVDSDEAGKNMPRRYEVCLITIRELERDHLTGLPALNYGTLYVSSGFDDVYHRVAQIPDNVPMNMRRVITKTIHRSSKPDWRLRWRWRPAAVAWTLCRRC